MQLASVSKLLTRTGLVEAMENALPGFEENSVVSKV